MPGAGFTTKGRDLVGRTIERGRLSLLSILGIGAYGVVYLARDHDARCSAECPCHLAQRPVFPEGRKRGSCAGPSERHQTKQTHGPRCICPCDHSEGATTCAGALVAVKCFSRKGLDERQRLFQCREAALHSLASSHPGVARVHRVFDEGEYTFIVREYFAGGDLFGMIADKQRYVGDDDLVRSVFLQIIDAVAHCHNMGVYHRDLKPENVLCSEDGSRVVVSDFGLATTEPNSKEFGCGSTFYISPECMGGLYEPVDSYSCAQADLWSLGVILVNLACVRNPWRTATLDDPTFRAYLQDPMLLRHILPLSPATVQILSGCFAPKAADRISLAQLRGMVMATTRFSTFTPRTVSVACPLPVQPSKKPRHCPAPIRPPSHRSVYTLELPSTPVSLGLPPIHGVFAPLTSDDVGYVTLPPLTPGGTPGLIESADPFGFGRYLARLTSASSAGSLPSTPGIAPLLDIVPLSAKGKADERDPFAVAYGQALM